MLFYLDMKDYKSDERARQNSFFRVLLIEMISSKQNSNLIVERNEVHHHLVAVISSYLHLLALQTKLLYYYMKTRGNRFKP